MKKYRITCRGSRFNTNTTSGEANLIQENSLSSMVAKFLGTPGDYKPRTLVPGSHPLDDGLFTWEVTLSEEQAAAISRLHAQPFGKTEYPNVTQQ